jgi:hypothetical protein
MSKATPKAGWIEVMYRTNPSPPESVESLRQSDYTSATIKPLSFLEFDQIFEVVEMMQRDGMPGMETGCDRPIREYDVISFYQTKPSVGPRTVGVQELGISPLTSIAP